jgi:hypothetical protein
MSRAYLGISRCRGRDGTTLHPKEHLPIESRKEPVMIHELFFLYPDAVALDPELPPLSGWLTLSFAGAVALVIALALTLG